MKWLALALVVFNLGVWQLGALSKPTGQSGTLASGTLPRVASLKIQGGAVDTASPLSGEHVCVRLGWIQSLDDARALKAHSVLAPASRLSVQEVDRPLPALHWVIVPPQPTDVALRQLREMQRQGIDSYLVAEGPSKNAISLGLFESQNAAISVLEEKKHKNFNAVLVNFDRNQISYALAFEVESNLAMEMAQALEADYGSEFDFIEIDRCEGVATSEKNP
ncbi:hypothetical protein [Marinobacter sp. S6332]|uniref:hypothetical protein n=1 Tax=Marinobacter sp. S6332 TaxID=2926403 RepID=UPI001FF37C09|nr:hypothetical protein [Marinobacter sp. S6332]MCK0165862.1 hypothetical protein [Marinobacter sp. S6332]